MTLTSVALNLLDAPYHEPGATAALTPESDQEPRPVVLWAEDDDDDATLLTRAWKKAEVEDELVRVRDGGEVIRYLEGRGIYSDRRKYPYPSLLVLDIKMPGPNGLEVAQWLRGQARWQNLPVVMLTSSAASTDVHEAARLGVRGYLVKPADAAEWLMKVKTLTCQCR